MTGRAVGRVLLGGQDKGSGFAITEARALTAGHVVRDAPVSRGDVAAGPGLVYVVDDAEPAEVPAVVCYQPEDGEPIAVTRIEVSTSLDVAVLHLRWPAPTSLPAAEPAAAGEDWRVETRPGRRDSYTLTGTVTDPRRRVWNEGGKETTLIQLLVAQQVGDYKGYSGSPVIAASAGGVLGVLVEQGRWRTSPQLGQPSPVANVLFAAPLEEVLAEFGLEGVAVARSVTVGASRQWTSVLPDRPAALVGRPGLLAALRQALLAADGQPVLAAGMGGAGKSVLAAQMARAVRESGDAELAAAYPAGVAWVTVGRERAVAAVQLELSRAFGEDQPDLGGDWRSGRARLQQLAAGQRGLLVLDDVWTQDRYEPFRLEAPGMQVLITTRNQTLADELGGVQVTVGELGKEQSRELLASQAGLLPQQLPAEAGELLSLVGDLALGVAMVGAVARERGPQAWPGLLRRLRERQLGKIAHKFADNYEYATLLRAIEVAVDDLDPADQERWADLAVFAGQGSVPEPAIATLWQPFDQDDMDTGDRIGRFLARSLLQAAGQGRYRLHDLQYDVAFLRLGPDRAGAQQSLAEVHVRLVDAYARRVADAAGASPQAGWAELAVALTQRPAADPLWQVADDGYLLGHIVDHLCRGGRPQDAAALVTEYDWITIGLTRRGLAQLAADYGLPTMDSLRIVRDALSRSARALSSDPDCLSDQLLGRLAGVQDPALARLLARLRAEQAHRPLQIIRSGLQQPSGSLVHILTGHQDPIWAVAVTGDGTRAVTGGDDGTLIVWDLAAGTALHTLTGHRGLRVAGVAVTSDGSRALTGGGDGAVIVWDLENGTPLHALTGQRMIAAVAVTSDGSRAVTGGSDGAVIVWGLENGTPLHTLTGHGGQQVAAVAVTGDSNRAVTGGYDGAVIVWDLATGRALRTLTGHRRPVAAVAVTGDGSRAVSGGEDGAVIVWDLATGTALHTLTGHYDRVRAVAASSDGTRAVTGGGEAVIVWDLATGTALRTLTGHPQTVMAVAVTGDGSRAVSGGYDGTAIVWDLATGRPLRTPTGHRAPVRTVAASGDGSRAVSGGYDGAVIVWDLATGTALRTLTGHTARVIAVAVTGDGSRAVSGGEDGAVIVWDLATGTALHTLTLHRSPVRGVTVTGDGSRAVSGGDDGAVIVWDLATGTALHTLTLHRSPVRGVTVTGDGSRAVSGGEDRAVIVWDLATGTALHTLTGHTARVMAVAVTGDGSRAVSGGEDGAVIVWDLATGKALHTLTLHRSPVRDVAVTGDGTRAVTSSWGRTVVWDLATGAPRHNLTGHFRVWTMAVTGDGSPAVTGGDDQTAVVWDLDAGTKTAVWHGDAAMEATAWAEGKLIFVVGDDLGAVHILGLRALGASKSQALHSA